MKKGDYRRSKKVEILKDRSAYKKGNVIEVHPVLAKRLIAEGVAEESTKKLTDAPVKVVAKLKTE